jgi:hypothetical protein
MHHATVIMAGPAKHAHSNKDRMQILVSQPWAEAGETYPATEIWGPADMPQPHNGEPILWDGGHIEFRVARYRKPEYDDDPDPSKPHT